MSYTLGDYVPFILTFEGSNKQAVDLLSTATSFRVALIKTATVGAEVSKKTGRKLNEKRDAVAKSVTWSPLSDDSAQADLPAKGGGQYTKTLHGEIRIPGDLPLAFEFPTMSVGVSAFIVEVPGPVL